jgi:hypothetical protein
MFAPLHLAPDVLGHRRRPTARSDIEQVGARGRSCLSAVDSVDHDLDGFPCLWPFGRAALKQPGRATSPDRSSASPLDKAAFVNHSFLKPNRKSSPRVNGH